MRKFAVFIVLLCVCEFALGQAYYNEWIDYNKTYYKCKVGATGLYRINANELTAIGLAGEPAENFQLWRNGKEVPLYTSTANGPLGINGYIEFWGERNDGVPDRNLYRLPAYQLSDRESLLTDTAAFFLTVNKTAGNLRFGITANNVSGNTLPAEPYFLHSLRNNFKSRIHRGWAEIVGERVYSSSYDIGEMWSSFDIDPTVTTTTPKYDGTPLTHTFSENLYTAASGPDAVFTIGMAGSANSTRNYNVTLNGTSILTASISSFNTKIDSISVPRSQLPANNASFTISNKDTNPFDHIVCNFIELKHARKFDFGGQATFNFSLPASFSGKYLEISNFAAGSSVPVLYDLTNLRRYIADISNTGLIRFALLPSAASANYVLVTQDAGSIKTITAFQPRTFLDFRTAANQGDYMIITHQSLQQPYSGANQIEAYRIYRSSVAGGGFNAKIYDIDQLVDQFGYGIKKNPLSIKNFLRFARVNFGVAPKYAFLIGKGLTYAEYREHETSPNADRLNLVPTWGYPASDVLLASNTMDPVMNTLIGRISVLYPQELAEYLQKMKDYDGAQQNNLQTIDNKAWMKNIVHVVGASDANLDQQLSGYMRQYETVIEDTLYGAQVTNFNKTATGPVTPITGNLMKQMFERGISLLSYFGHSSASALDYNLNDPSEYNNTGKYPIFCVSGCNAGNLYSYDTSRYSVLSALSEIFVLAKNKGSIGFIASTHFGVTTYLDIYNQNLYKSISRTGYGKSITYNMSEAINAFNSFPGVNNRLARLHAEQTTLNGDPATKVNTFLQPDFVVEEPQVRITPNIVSVADVKFEVKAFIYNVGKATGDSVSLRVRRQYPNGSDSLIYNKRIKSIRFEDSITIEVPIVASRDKGANKITVTVDADNRYAEISESNNTATISFLILEDELTPVYPYNYAIINRSNAKLIASTAEPAGVSRQYVMEVDTTELFNSTFKITKSATSAGGIIEFDPGIIYTDSTVYYWRVAPVPSTGAFVWNNASFVYVSGTNTGFNQSHKYQHLKSQTSKLDLDPADGKWKFENRLATMVITNAVFPNRQDDSDFRIILENNPFINSGCVGHSVLFSVFDPKTLKAYYNQQNPSTVPSGVYGGFMNSFPSCAKSGREYNFEFSYLDTAGRRKMRDFMDWVPAGSFVTARLVLDEPFDQTPFAAEWKNDQLIYGAGNTIYDRLKNAGFADIDSFDRPRTWVFVYKKDDPSGLNDLPFQPVSKFTSGTLDALALNVTLPAYDTSGHIVSPHFGPATSWKEVIWRGAKSETGSGDIPVVNVLGITPAGQADTLFRLNINQQNFDISSVSAAQYPYIKLDMFNRDGTFFTPYQLKYWRLYYEPVPEGGLAASLNYRFKDTLELGENLDFSIAFKNVSDAAFSDSLKTNVVIYDKNNVATIIPIVREKKLQPGDTTQISSIIDTKIYEGNNTLFVDVNPNFAQPEQYRFNNFMYKNFYIRSDTYNPLMDVTFDGVHILNGDIVSARPKIVIQLKDEAKFLALDDTSLATVYIRYPGTNTALNRVAFGTDTLKFIPADLSSGKNEATIEFTPALLQDSDGDFYELVVKAKDKSGNAAGNIEYRVRFQVYNKPMISNMFNYPNPFTTSTAFVFTVTGSEVPQNIRIQIMTVTGKVVKEITKMELGPLHIGRNITEYKWDGTDQYGSKLGNGIYLYRVITNLNGASLDKFNTTDSFGDKIDTDKYFNKGYGKMYLMR